MSTEKTIALNEPVDPSILTSMQTGVPQGLTGIPQRPAQENDAIPRVAPKWLKHDRHVSPLSPFLPFHSFPTRCPSVVYAHFVL